MTTKSTLEINNDEKKILFYYYGYFSVLHGEDPSDFSSPNITLSIDLFLRTHIAPLRTTVLPGTPRSHTSLLSKSTLEINDDE